MHNFIALVFASKKFVCVLLLNVNFSLILFELNFCPQSFLAIFVMLFIHGYLVTSDCCVGTRRISMYDFKAISRCQCDNFHI